VSNVLWLVTKQVTLEAYSTRRPHQQVPVHWEESAPAPFKTGLSDYSKPDRGIQVRVDRGDMAGILAC